MIALALALACLLGGSAAIGVGMSRGNPCVSWLGLAGVVAAVIVLALTAAT